MEGNEHIILPLVNVIRQGHASLQHTIDVLATRPSADGLLRLSEEANSLSGAVSALARVVSLDQLGRPPAAPTRAPAHDFDSAKRLIAALAHGVCDKCGGAIQDPDENEKDENPVA